MMKMIEEKSIHIDGKCGCQIDVVVNFVTRTYKYEGDKLCDKHYKILFTEEPAVVM